MVQGQVLSNGAPHGVTKESDLGNLQIVQKFENVIGHFGNGVGPWRLGATGTTTIIANDDAMMLLEGLALEDPGEGVGGQSGDEDERRSRSTGIFVV